VVGSSSQDQVGEMPAEAGALKTTGSGDRAWKASTKRASLSVMELIDGQPARLLNPHLL